MTVEVDIARLQVQVAELDHDVKVFAPIIQDVERIKWQITTIQNSLDLVTKKLDHLIETDERREETTRRQRYIIWGALLGLLGTFITSTASVLASVL